MIRKQRRQMCWKIEQLMHFPSPLPHEMQHSLPASEEQEQEEEEEEEEEEEGEEVGAEEEEQGETWKVSTRQLEEEREPARWRKIAFSPTALFFCLRARSFSPSLILRVPPSLFIFVSRGVACNHD